MFGLLKAILKKDKKKNSLRAQGRAFFFYNFKKGDFL